MISILKTQRRSSTARVSFDRKFALYDDGTCEITDLFSKQPEDMELTLLDVCDPSCRVEEQSDMDITNLDQTMINETAYSEMPTFDVGNFTQQSEDNTIIKDFLNETIFNASTINDNESMELTLRDDASDFARELNLLKNHQTSFLLVNKSLRLFIITNVDDRVVDISCEQIKTTVASDNFESNLDVLKNDLLGCPRADVLNRLLQLDMQARSLGAEIEALQLGHRWVMREGHPSELAIKIRGLRYGLWLLLSYDPATYPYEEIRVRFAVNKLDRHLYPFSTFAAALKRSTKCGQPLYITRLVENAKRFIRFFKKVQ